MYKSGRDVEETTGVGYPTRSPIDEVDVDVSKFETRKRGVNLIGLKADWNFKFWTPKLHVSYKNGFKVGYVHYILYIKYFQRETGFRFCNTLKAVLFAFNPIKESSIKIYRRICNGILAKWPQVECNVLIRSGYNVRTLAGFRVLSI